MKKKVLPFVTVMMLLCSDGLDATAYSPKPKYPGTRPRTTDCFCQHIQNTAEKEYKRSLKKIKIVMVENTGNKKLQKNDRPKSISVKRKSLFYGLKLSAGDKRIKKIKKKRSLRSEHKRRDISACFKKFE
ncbi:MAG: hypothetical protein PSX36_11635 [bacterium]|nr:hypothetical protein [bacterium]